MQEEEPVFITIPLQTFKDILNEVQSLKDQINALETRQNEDIERLGQDIAYDRQRLAKLAGQTAALTEDRRNP